MSSRQSPLQRGHLTVLANGHPVISIEVECRYPALLQSALTSFLRPGHQIEWQQRTIASARQRDAEATAIAVARHIAGGPEPDQDACNHAWTVEGNCLHCGARYHGATALPVAPRCSHGQYTAIGCDLCNAESS